MMLTAILCGFAHQSFGIGLDDWFIRDNDTTNDLFGIAFAAGKFVAVGQAGRIITSTNGVAWQTENSPTTDKLTAIAHGDGLFVAVGNKTIVVSSNGRDWILRAQPPVSLSGVAHGRGTFVAVGGMATGSNTLAVALASTNGSDWTLSEMGVFNEVTAVTYGNGLFVAVTVYNHDVLISTNGAQWEVSALKCYNPRFAVTYGKERLVAVGLDTYCPSFPISVSPDAINWDDQQAGTNGLLFGVGFGGGTFAAVGGLYDVLVTESRITTSTDGSNWTPRTAPTSSDLQAVTFGNATFVAVGKNGTILQSGNFGDVNLSAVRDPSSAALRLTIVGQSNWIYRLQSNTNLGANVWSDVTTVSNTQNGVTLTNLFDLEQRFYRVVAP
jgi:hypothetical protein